MKLIITNMMTLIVVALGSYFEALAASSGNLQTDSYATFLNEPHIAFVCGKPTMHSTKQGWIADQKQDCIHDPDEILTYCKRTYPTLKINNIEPSITLATITDWCKFDQKDCTVQPVTTHVVKPYRCLVGRFQSIPLLVPAHCRFGHVNFEPQKICEPYNHWNTTADQECTKQGKKLQSFGVLFPCKKDAHHQAMHFSGVEFVCCPIGQESGGNTKASKGHVITDKDSPGTAPANSNVHMRYLAMIDDPDAGTEHDRYVEAKEALAAERRTKEKQLEQELADGEAKLAHLWSVDPQGTKKAEEDLIQHFYTEFGAFEEEEVASLRQLDSVHQQRVDRSLEAKKVDASRALDYVLQEMLPQADRIARALERAIRVLQKDRIHSINHLEHLRATDPEQAARNLPSIQEHLRVIDRQIREIMAKLDKVPSLKPAVLRRLARMQRTYTSVETEAKAILDLPDASPPPSGPAPTPAASNVDVIVNKYRHKTDGAGGKPGPTNHADKKNKQQTKSVVHVEPVQDPVETNGGHDNQKHGGEDDEEVVINHVLHDPHVHPITGGKVTHDLGVELAAHSNRHAAKDSYSHESGHLITRFSTEARSNSLAIWVSVGASCAVLIVGAVVVVVLRYRQTHPRSHAGYTMSVVEMDTPTLSGQRPQRGFGANTEDKHLASWQLNGYENPTYKYFEKEALTSPGGTAVARQ